MSTQSSTRRLRPGIGLSCALLAIAATASVDAGVGLRWPRDGGRAENAAVPPQLSRRSAGSVEIAVEAGVDGGWEVWVDNPLFGPVEALVHGRSEAFEAMPALPARVRVPAQRRALATRLSARADARPHPSKSPQLRLQAVPGDPSARPQDVDYRYPLGEAELRIAQGWGGSFSHRDAEHRYALDFAAPAGTPVRAARPGVVMQVVVDDHGEALRARSDLAAGNAVRVLHEDGSMALYAHLSHEGLNVRPGQRVHRGEIIARVGSSGFSTGPHLHFVVQVNRGMRLESLPFRMSGPGGLLRLRETP